MTQRGRTQTEMLRPVNDANAPETAVPSGLSRVSSLFVDIGVRERPFLILLLFMFFVAGVSYDKPALAAWVGFAFAGYSAVANDSIQTIGTFIASNRNQRWWVLWLFIGGIFLLTVGYSWAAFDGDVSYRRLMSKGFDQSPTSFSFLQIAAPLFLMVLTRLRMPVSTTFLLLSSFATSTNGVAQVLTKSLAGYGVAFVSSIVLYAAIAHPMQRWTQSIPHPGWRIGQWITSGLLWSVWLMQDAANIAVYLPRSLSVIEFAAFSIVIFLGLGILFWMGGERVQEVVDEKSHVVDVRAATVIDLVYAVILYYFQFINNIPMSTTWVFIGLLGGRELAMAWRGTSTRTWQQAVGLLTRDLVYVSIGLLISLIIAFTVNEEFRRAFLF